jgi:predicted transposase YdaD
MRKSWDRRMKLLFGEAPQDLVQWLFAGATFVSIVPNELNSETIFADMLLELVWYGERFLLHIEFQRRRDARMAQRMWDYNVRATLQHKCPVWSCVIYLKEDGKAATPVLDQRLPTGRVVHHFEFDVIRLWEIPTEELRRKGLFGLLPLLILTKEGHSREVVEEVIAQLMPVEEEPKRELLSLTYGLASLAFEDHPADLEWLARRFEMLYDILEDSPAFKALKNKGRQEGLQEGRQEGRQEGQLEALQQALTGIVQARFPQMGRLTKRLAGTIDNTEMLQDLIVKMSMAQTIEEARQQLLDVVENEEEDE